MGYQIHKPDGQIAHSCTNAPSGFMLPNGSCGRRGYLLHRSKDSVVSLDWVDELLH